MRWPLLLHHTFKATQCKNVLCVSVYMHKILYPYIVFFLSGAEKTDGEKLEGL